MARVTIVNKAQARYKTVPALNEDGTPRVVNVMRNGQQKVTKHGKPVTMRVMVEDKTQPLPERSCDFPGCTINGGKIAVGTSYKWVKPKSGPYGGSKRNRHAEHPSWKPWDLSNSTSARIQQITDLDGVDTGDLDEVRSFLESAAEQIRDLGQEKADGADNIESGFGHETSQSEELRQLSEDLESWADDVESAAQDLPESADCEACEGSGKVDEDQEDTENCDACDGEGEVKTEDEDGTETIPCEACDGHGQITTTETVEVDCDTCDGTGMDPDVDLDEALAVLDESPA